MFETLPRDYAGVAEWTWDDYEPYVEDMLARDLNDETAETWLADCSLLMELLHESSSRLYKAKTQNTADEDIKAAYNSFLENMMPRLIKLSNDANQKMVRAEVSVPDFDVPLRNMIADIELFRTENLPLITQDRKLGAEYGEITGAQSIEWAGEEYTLQQADKFLMDDDRATREGVWRAQAERQLQDRDALNTLFGKLLANRHQMAKNADFDNYRDYMWKSKKRFDYTPDDIYQFHETVEQVVVPAAARLYEKRRSQLGVERLRPWDLEVDALGRPPLAPFEDVDEMSAKMSTLLHEVDGELAGYFDHMRENDLLDLANRKNKNPGGYNMTLARSKVPFIFMNSVGIHRNVQTLLHEAGHAFHTFESSAQPYAMQRNYPTEFAEVASMSMELIGGQYLTAYYSPEDTARARIEHYSKVITFFPYAMIIDAFQQWVYTNHEQAADPANCDAAFGDLWDRFMVGIDYDGLEEVKVTGWHRKMHIFQYPLYYIEYAIAQLGALQVWANSLEDEAAAIAAYRASLQLGGTRTLPELFAAAGAALRFDPEIMQRGIDLLENGIAEMEAQA